jgi:hypothetical protein
VKNTTESLCTICGQSGAQRVTIVVRGERRITIRVPTFSATGIEGTFARCCSIGVAPRGP